MKRLLSLLSMCAVVVLSGCAVTKDGVRLPGGQVSKADFEEFRTRNGVPEPTAASPANSAPSITERVAKEAGKEVIKRQVKASIFNEDMEAAGKVAMIIIGTTMTVTDYTPQELAKQYDRLEKQEKDKGRPVLMTREFWMDNLAASSSVQLANLPLIGHRSVQTLVSKQMRDKVNFASALGASMVGSSADLVAAEAFANRGVWITRVLCSEKQPDFSDCSKKYARGRYQSLDGREIGGDLKVLANGKQIDLNTFELMAAPQ
jgi:hypothetical protein